MLDGLRVLVVEDEAAISMLLEELLDALGCTVVAVAARLEDAMQKARTLAVDIAMLDVNLAGKQSYPVAQILRDRDIPFFFATGYGVEGLSADLQDAPVLVKPFRQAQLAAMLGAASRTRPGSG
ncbi:response regulator [Acidisoma sp.]|uniref:response regulator n=1 Tax=Acidisoma sp. TaxID=1872115 RepID=UPI003B000FA3